MLKGKCHHNKLSCGSSEISERTHGTQEPC